MKGYFTNAGYMGWLPDEKKYVLFATETDYVDYYLSMYAVN